MEFLCPLDDDDDNDDAGNNQGLMNLYKDMESCGGYTDIQVMWEIIHSSSPPNGYCARRKRTYWKFCFRPT